MKENIFIYVAPLKGMQKGWKYEMALIIKNHL
jgi:hypothetical protein